MGVMGNVSIYLSAMSPFIRLWYAGMHAVKNKRISRLVLINPFLGFAMHSTSIQTLRKSIWMHTCRYNSWRGAGARGRRGEGGGSLYQSAPSSQTDLAPAYWPRRDGYLGSYLLPVHATSYAYIGTVFSGMFWTERILHRFFSITLVQQDYSMFTLGNWSKICVSVGKWHNYGK